MGLSNGNRRSFRELVYDHQDNLVTFNTSGAVLVSNIIYIREHLYELVKINSSQVETSLDRLQSKMIHISLVKKESTISIKYLLDSFSSNNQREASDRIHVNRTQLPIIRVFAITTYNAQGNRRKMVVDLQLPSIVSQVASVYVPFGRVKRATV